MRSKTAAVMIIAVSALELWFFSMGLVIHYDATMPNTPDAASGRVILQNSHGSIVYLTHSQQLRIRVLEFGSGALFLIAVALGKWWKVPTDSLRDFPPEVRERIQNGPDYEYDKIRKTYGSRNSDDA